MEESENKKSNDEVIILNDLTDYELARQVLTTLLDKKVPISARRAEKILDVAKSMIPDIANIYYK